MPNHKTHKKQSASKYYWDFFVKVTRIWYFIAVFGPLILLYVHMFCVKNGCILPRSIPSQLAVYINKVSITVLFVCLTRNIWVKVAWRLVVPLSYGNEYQTLITPFFELVFFSAVLSAVYATRPNVLMAVQENLAAILSTLIVFTVLFNLVMSWAFLGFKGRILGGFFSIFFHGSVFVMMNPPYLPVIWGLLDMVFMLNAIGTSSVNNSAIFIFGTQYFFLSITHLFGNSFKGYQNRVAFMRQERVGYICMAKFFILIPFLGSLPLLHATVSDVATHHPSPAHFCCYLAIFAVGFVIYATVNYKIDRFLKDESTDRELAHVAIRSNPCETTIKRLMASDYWYCVYRPDYLGLLLIWISWLLACGVNSTTMVMLVLGVVILAASAHQSATTTFCQKRGLEDEETLYTLESAG